MLASSCEQIYFVQILHYNWDYSFRVQQERVGNPSINTKHPCPHAHNKALPNSPHVKYAHILHITQQYVLFIFAVGCLTVLYVLFICRGIENDEDWFGCQCNSCADIVLNARPSLTLCFFFMKLFVRFINVLGFNDVILAAVNFMEGCNLE